MNATMEKRVALVTGASGALGAVVLRHLEGLGFLVEEPLLPGKTRADLASETDVAALFERIERERGRLDVLASIVGGFAYAALADTDLETWERMMRLNATTAFLCARAAAPLMRRRRWGRIINVSSAPALNRGAPGMSAYSASKAAVMNLTESLAKELAADGITVNAIVPAIIDTAANRKSMPKADTSKWLKPEEIARVIGFLASEEAAIVTGSAILLGRG